MIEIIRRIRRISMSQDLDPNRHPVLGAVPAALMALAKRRSVKAGEMLFRSGGVPRSVVFVRSGEIQLLRRGRDGKDIVLQRSRGGFVAEASIDARTYHCDVVATAAGDLILFPLAEFKAALEGNGEFHRAWSSNLARVVRTLRAQCERLSLNSAAERIIHYLESEGDAGVLSLKQSRKAWATEMGLTHESLYRTLKRLEAEGEVEVSGSRIARRDPEPL